MNQSIFTKLAMGEEKLSQSLLMGKQITDETC